MWIVGFTTTFIGLVIGGGLAAIVNQTTRSIATIFALCAGLLLGLLSLEIAPEAIHLGGWLVFGVGFFGGVLLFMITHKWLHRYPIIRKDAQKTQWIRSGILLAVIILLHNLPMGVVLGASHHTTLNLSLLQTLALHTIPEGMILFTPLLLARVRVTVIFLLAIIVSIPVGIGAYIGNEMGQQFDMLLGLFISVTVGTIYMITIKEILPEAVKRSSNLSSLFIVCIGFGVMWVYMFIV